MDRTIPAMVVLAILLCSCTTLASAPTPTATPAQVALEPSATAPANSTPAPSPTPTVSPANAACVRATTQLPEGQNPTRFTTSGPATGCYDSVGDFLDDTGLEWAEFAPGVPITFWTQSPVDSEGILIPPTPTAPPPTPQPTPIVYVTLGSPYPPDCGDGIPLISSNDSPNGPFLPDRIDQFHGHVDIIPPTGCDVANMTGEVIAPVSGYLQAHAVPHGYHLFLPPDVYVAGTEDALRFAGVQNPDLSLISDIRLHFGHLAATDGNVEKGRPIGDLVEDWNYPYWKLGYQVTFLYDGVEYMFSPTLFGQDVAFECEPGSIYDCTPEPHDYAP